jgi:putative membrane protein
MTFKYVQTIVVSTAILSSPALLFAQSDAMAVPISQASQTQPNYPQQSPTPTTAMQDSGQSAGETSQAMKDKMFLHKAAQGGMAEVQFGQLALQKASSDDVKSFAQKMVDDHTALNNEMAPIADSMGVRAPKTINKQDQAEYDKLSGLSGTDFDTEYLTAMVKDHHKDLHEFRAEAATTTDPTLKAAVEKAEKVIHEHTVMVDKLARDKGVPVPQRGPNKPTPAPTS